jgi:hypothetical protein
MNKNIAIGVLKRNKTEFVRELKKSEIDIYNKNSKILIEANKSSWIFEILKMNYFTFMEETWKDFESLDFKENIPWEIMEQKSILINKRFGSFLSSFSSFHDHTRLYLSRTFGKKSDELNTFNQAASTYFDNNFGYRFFSKGLRDYSIHCGMPLISIKIKHNNVEKVVTLLFDRDELLKNWDWKALIKPEIENQPDFFEVTNLVYDAMKNTQELNKVLETINNDLINKASQIIKENFEFNNEENSKSCFLIWNENEKIENARIGQIPFHLISTEYPKNKI